MLGRAVHDAIPPVSLAFWRWTLAALIVVPLVWKKLRANWPLLRAHLGRMTALAILGVTGFNTLVYTGLQSTTATNSVLVQSTMPVQIFILNAVLFGVAVTAREFFSILLSLSGVVLIISAGQPQNLLLGNWNPGDLWILAAALVWASYSVLLRWRPAGLDAGAFLGFILLVGWVALAPLYAMENASGATLTWNLPVVLTVLYVAIFPSALAYVFWHRGVAAIGANAAGHFIHLMPVLGTALAMLFLGEVFRWYHGIGALMVGAGIAVTWHAGRA